MKNERIGRYFKSKKLGIKKEIKDKYVDLGNGKILISNGYSVVMLDDNDNHYGMSAMDDKYSSSVKRCFDIFKNMYDSPDTHYTMYDMNRIKENIEDKKCFDMKNGYAIDYLLLKKIIDIIGCVKLGGFKYISVMDNGKDNPIIIVFGKNKNVGYLLPMLFAPRINF